MIRMWICGHIYIYLLTGLDVNSQCWLFSEWNKCLKSFSTECLILLKNGTTELGVGSSDSYRQILPFCSNKRLHVHFTSIIYQIYSLNNFSCLCPNCSMSHMKPSFLRCNWLFKVSVNSPNEFEARRSCFEII